jgi:hypothetical protein
MKKDNIFTAFLVLAILVGLYFSFKLVKPTPRPVINCNHPNRAYAFDVVDDSVYIYTEDDKFIATIKLDGQLDSFIVADNE